jgi:hypothetical protein
LGGAGRSKTLHLAFSYSDRNMGAFDPVVLPFCLVMASRETEFPDSG